MSALLSSKLAQSETAARDRVVSVAIVLIGQQEEPIEQGIERLVARHAGIAVLRTGPDDEPVAPELPAESRLAWLFVREADLASHAVSRWCRRLLPVVPVTVAAYRPSGQPTLDCATDTLPPGTFLQPCTADSAPHVFAVIDAFLSRATQPGGDDMV